MAVIKKLNKESKKTMIKKKKKTKTNSVKNSNRVRRGAVYISNLPYGFYERALHGYFSQFGTIRRLKVARSLKNAKPMGWAFLEFQHEKVALIVAKTMNNYLMFKKILKCEFIKHEDIRHNMFKNRNLTPELCPGTLNRRRNQYILENEPTSFYSCKKKKKIDRIKSFLENTLGMNIEIPEEEEEQSQDKLVMSYDGSDEEISIKTPPNVEKKKKKGGKKVEKVASLMESKMDTVKAPQKKRKLSLFSKEVVPKDEKVSNKKQKKSIVKSENNSVKKTKISLTDDSLKKVRMTKFGKKAVKDQIASKTPKVKLMSVTQLNSPSLQERKIIKDSPVQSPQKSKTAKNKKIKNDSELASKKSKKMADPSSRKFINKLSKENGRIKSVKKPEASPQPLKKIKNLNSNTVTNKKASHVTNKDLKSGDVKKKSWNDLKSEKNSEINSHKILKKKVPYSRSPIMKKVHSKKEVTSPAANLKKSKRIEMQNHALSSHIGKKPARKLKNNAVKQLNALASM